MFFFFFFFFIFVEGKHSSMTNQKLDKIGKGQGSRRVKIGPIAEIYDFLICCRIIYLMKKNVIFICFALKLCDKEVDT